MNDKTVRIDSLLSQRGYCARRKVQDFLCTHHVTADDVVIRESGERVSPDAQIFIDGQKIRMAAQPLYIALNKPEGYLCSMADPHGRRLAVDLIPESKTQRIYHVGRLDYDSCGLILFTNDGAWAQRLSHPKYEIEKEYEVHVNQPFSKSILEAMKEGIFDQNEQLKIERYEIVKNNKCVKITLKEGKNREIRRLFGHFGLKVKTLKRLRIGNIFLGKLGQGERRILKIEEVEFFR